MDLKGCYKRCTLSLLFAILVIGFSFGQTEIDSSDAEKASIIRYSLDDNTLQINDIVVDNNNRVIVSTNNMLLTIGNANVAPFIYLDGEYLQAATVDNKNTIYAGGKNTLFNAQTGEKYALEDPSAVIKDLTFYKGKVWVGTDKGLHVFIPTSQNWKVYTRDNSKLRSDIINFVQADDKDVLWVGTEKGYVKIEDDDWESEDKKYNVLLSRHNKEGQWMVAKKDMWLIDPFNRKYDVGLNTDLYQGEINDFVIDSKGRLYMASDVIVRYNPYKDKIEKYGEEVGLLSQKCLSLACDKNNNIWIGTADAGLFRILFDDIAKEQLLATVIVKNHVSCNGKSDGALEVSVTGGSRPYKYEWSESQLRGMSPSALAAGSYAVTVTDKYGSQYVSEATISEPEPISVVVDETQRVTGFGKNDGFAKITAQGGEGELSYKWSDGSTKEDLMNVGPGTYSVSVSDENGCVVTAQGKILKEKYIPELEISKVGIGQTLAINELTFKADSTNLDPQNYEILDEVYDFLTTNKDVVIEIGGHTNTIPPHEYCDRLSTERARSVAEYIVNKGIDQERVSYKGYGKRQPLTESRDSAARKKNQRVEVKIISL